MRPILRQAAAVPFGSRSWHGLSRAGKVNARLLQSDITATPRPATRKPVQLSRIYNACLQMRRYSSSVATTTATPLVEEVRSKAKRSGPLHILFCGSDEFSCAALEALDKERRRNPELIQSITVVARPTKMTGRGNQKPKSPPIVALVTKLELPIHRLDTFTGWDMPRKTNLIIAVSFGLFVPPRLLRQAEYGGLNLHPSFLPDLRGPAPIQHALLAGRTQTGVSLQTLDEKAFDHGLVLARTAPVPIPPHATSSDLLATLTPLAAALLVRGLRDGVHVPPREETAEHADALRISLGEGPDGAPNRIAHAPKITARDRQVRMANVAQLSRRQRVLGRQWFWVRNNEGARKRVIIEEVAGEDMGLVGVKIPVTLTLRTGAPSASGLSLDRKSWMIVRRTSETFMMKSAVGMCVPRLVRLEEGDEEGSGASSGGDDDNSSSRIILGKNADGTEETFLVVWVSDEVKNVVYIGAHRIEKMKVEGEFTKAARRALLGSIIRLEDVKIEE
ncbi:Formyltransferase [Daldinia caldariorum]|uniref:Formyltransferase n=1 Tax=Daldinia caldariorum TaxID=326644 RepID=UPI0020081336|nr:Formyltransferase [Daldinia caldariorum]KAI1468071.1 Formyltransferase [Daldinia caldariorum]